METEVLTSVHFGLHLEWVFLSMLNKREVDVMVGDIRVLGDTKGLDITELPQHPICYVCRAGHPYAKRKQMVLGEIFDYPIATPWIPNVIYQLVASELGLPVAELTAFKNGLIECSYFKLLIDVVLTSNAIGCGLVPIFSDGIDRKKLCNSLLPAGVLILRIAL